MKPGRDVRARSAADVQAHDSRSPAASLLAGGGVAAASLATGAAQARIRPADMVPLIGPGYRPTDARRARPVAANGAGRGGDRRLQPADQGPGARPPICSDLIGKVGGPAAQGSAHLSGAHPRVQRLHGPDRLHGHLLRPAPADARRGAARRRHRPRSRPFPAPPPDPPVARHAHARPTSSRSWRWAPASAGGAAGVYTGDMSSSPSSAPSCRCSPTAARWRPRPTRWACG